LIPKCSRINKLPRRILDIVENIELAQEFLGKLDARQFASDEKTYYAVIRALEIVSEASRHIPDEMKTRHPKIAWHAVR